MSGLGRFPCRMFSACIIFLFYFVYCHGEKILMIPASHSSHVNFFSISGKALKEAGHEVYVLTHEQHQDRVEKQGVKAVVHSSAATMEFENSMIQENDQYFKGTVGPSQIYKLIQFFTKVCIEMNEDIELVNRLENFNFDLAIVDGVFFTRCLYVIPYRLNIPFVTLNANDDPWSAGLPAMPSMQPMQIGAFSNKMNFIQRVQNTLIFVALQILPRLFIPNSIIQDFAPQRPDISFAELYGQSKVVLVNLDSICFDYPRISAPHYHFLAGAGNSPAKRLPADIEEFVADAADGVILVSFGSIPAYSRMPHSILKKFMDAFASIEQKVIMKYDGEPYPDVPKNVKLLSWLPQNDILGHSKVKLFITHGGNNGQLESLFHGVPMLTIPLTGDQHYNAERVVVNGYGLKTSFATLTADQLREDMTNIISNSDFQKNIQKCSAIIKSFPNPQSTIVFWVNHVLKFGGDHLRPPTLDMNFIQMFTLDVFALLLVLLGVVAYIEVKVFMCCARMMCCKSNKKTKKE